MDTGKLLPIRLIGDHILSRKAEPVAEINQEIKTFVENLLFTMYERDGVGLAAPQVGRSLRIFTVDVKWTTEGKNPLVFINPEIIGCSGEISMEEGCISLPGIYTDVTRAEEIEIKAFDADGKSFTLHADGMLARAIQHEYDHLDGIVFLERIPKMRQLFYRRQVRQLKKGTDENGNNIRE